MFTAILSVMLAIGIVTLFILVRAEERHQGLIFTTIACMICVSMALVLEHVYVARQIYNALGIYYVVHAWLYFLVMWTINEMTVATRYRFFKNPSFYVALAQTIIIVANGNAHKIFIVVPKTLWGHTWMVIKMQNYWFQIYKDLSFVAVIILITYLISNFKKVSKIYLSRTRAILIWQFTFSTIEIIASMNSWPILIIAVLMTPSALVATYYAISYTPNTFKTWALSNIANNSFDAYILYDSKDRFIYANSVMTKIVNVETFDSFTARNNFIKWSKNTEEMLGKKVIRIPQPDDNGVIVSTFFRVKEHLLTDQKNGAYLGIFYHAIDITDSINTFQKISEANAELENAAKMKSDFLANMSHEIRTPMNAVIGMAEMALREEMTPESREYISQIKTSGQAMLAIINDILDFSKIESGKMDISFAEYEGMSLAEDVSGIIATRIGAKKVELILDIDPNLPYRLLGDNIRIKQIITNLANNAVKFTEQGHVTIKIGFEPVDERNITLKCSVRDSGIGIKPEDLDRLFQSFTQVDSKRNRNVEGTGLGLAISKQLVGLMNGKISVESEYGAGSCFSFEVPQLVMEEKPSVKVKDADKLSTIVYANNPYVGNSLINDIEKFNIKTKAVETDAELESELASKPDFVFIEEEKLSDKVNSLIRLNKHTTFVLIVKQTLHNRKLSKNMIELRKPAYVLNLGAVFNHENLYETLNRESAFSIDFIAPDAEVLIVDDNTINLTVAEGLISPLKMTVDTALSGAEALDKISRRHYDIVFMDHMMPGMDGIETTHHIREEHPDYNDVPIIALTANALEEAKSIFLTEGMNDFIAKPIEVSVIIQKIRRWLPDAKVIPVDSLTGNDAVSEDVAKEKAIIQELRHVEGVDVNAALKLVGTESLLIKVVGDYFNAYSKKFENINRFFMEEDIKSYKIEVHALKSASRQIGDEVLAKLAESLEKAANDGDWAYIEAETGNMLTMYTHLIKELTPIFKQDEVNKDELAEIGAEDLKAIFEVMLSALENLDMGTCETEIEKLASYRFSTEEKDTLSKLKDAIDAYDSETAIELINNWPAH